MGGAGEEGEGEAVRVVVVAVVISHCVGVSDRALHLSVEDFLRGSSCDCLAASGVSTERFCGESMSDF